MICTNGFLDSVSQEPPFFAQPPPPPPPPPVAETIVPLPSPAPQQQPPQPRSESLPPPPEPRRFGSPDEPKRGGLNKGETVGLVFAGLAAMLQVLVVVFLVLKRRQLLQLKETQ
ncbi:hypothetical protein Bca52824_038915 [Brassica carinata]|uniref:Uncharacterized protein n=1 Tax=Brassica carinata TaxID=52824 RepID=A0A8X7UWE8_BRACI|nr:hypothetical protein Bca52824_038915 [Brassica carinata]